MRVPILFPKIFDYPFTYKSEISEKLKPGDFVKAPFGNIELTGVVWPKEQKTEKDFKSVYKKIKRNKKYFISIKDIVVLDSLVADGISLPDDLKYNQKHPKYLLIIMVLHLLF